MKKFALLLAFIMVLSFIVSCRPKEDSSDELSDLSNDNSETSTPVDELDPNNINSVQGIDNALTIDLNREKSYKRVNIINGNEYTLLTEPSKTYADDGKKLTDKVIAKGGDGFDHSEWIGFVAKKRIEFIVDLGEKVSGIAELGVNVNYNPSESRSAPKTIDYFVSDDGETFTRVGTSTSTNDFSAAEVYTHLLVLQKGIETRYVKVIMSGITSNWIHIDSFQAYVYEPVEEVVQDKEYYINEPMPEVKSPVYWDKSESDFTTRKNLILGLPQRIYASFSLPGVHQTNYYNTPASSTLLTDGKKGGNSYSHPNFFHITRGLERDIIYDLTKLSAVDTLTIGMLMEDSTGISLANLVTVNLSENGEDWMQVAQLAPNNPDRIDNDTIRFTLDFGELYKARFVKISVRATKHLWIDEIEVFGTKDTSKAKTITPDEVAGPDIIGYPTPDKLGGSENILLAYNFKTENPSVGLTTKEEYLPYVGYYDTKGELKDIFFDSYLYLPCATVCPSGAYLHHDSKNPAFASDWLAYEDDLFAEGYNINALNEAVSEIKSELKKDDFVSPVYLSIFSTVATQTNFGDIGGGRSLNFNNIEDRKAAITWWIDRQIARYEKGNYENLKLNGFYWFHEALELNDPEELELAKFTSDYVHSLGYFIVWIPYYQSLGFSEWDVAGFDVANMQPNYMFVESATEDVVYENARLTKELGMGVEIEIDGKVFSSNEYYHRYLSYLRAGVETGYMNGIKMYYQDAGPGVYYNAYKSTKKEHRNIYDLTYLYAKGKLTVSKHEIDQTTFDGEKNTPLVGSIRLKDSIGGGTIQSKVAISAKYGQIALSPNGSFTYTPMPSFTGTDTFTVFVSDGISSTTREIIVNIK